MLRHALMLATVFPVSLTFAQVERASAFGPPSAAPQETNGAQRALGGVYLVGTGPGDPELISRKAARLLRKADLVFCYHWMKDELARFVRPGVVEVAPPLLQGGRYFRQNPEELSAEERERVARANEALAKLKARLAKLVAEGKTVAFADNGDPSLFSPWGWLPEQLAEFDLVVVPGISSFNAGNAALKQNVSCLGSVIISSGGELGTPDAAGRLAGTIVFFTHRTKLEQLLPEPESRYPADTPAAIVCDASYPTEKVIRGSLGNIFEVLAGEKLPHLYLFYVGDGLGQTPAPETAEPCGAVYGDGADAITVATGSPGELGLLEALANAFSRKHDDAVLWGVWSGVCLAAEDTLILATTTSTENSGLLAYLHPDFERKTRIRVKVVAKGTGASLQLARDGNADLILVHAREQEDQFVADGYGVMRRDVMVNDFILIGPETDPAGIRGVKDPAEALCRVARRQSEFISRGDGSGTHIREQQLWRRADLPLESETVTLFSQGKKKRFESVRPAGDWYLSIGQGMGKTILIATEKRAYTLADRGTYYSFALAQPAKTDLAVLCQGHESLYNPYGVIAVDPQRYPHVNFAGAKQYIEWITSPEIQRMVGEHKVQGKVLFHPNAAPAGE